MWPIGITIFLAGMGLALYGFVGLRVASRTTARWKTTKGRIVDVSISGADYFRYSNTPNYYIPEITYRYVVKGVEYESWRTSLYPRDQRIENVKLEPVSAGQQREARKIRKKYKKNSPVTVYYDPENPGESVLHVGISDVRRADLQIYLGLGIVAGAIGGGLIVLFG